MNNEEWGLQKTYLIIMYLRNECEVLELLDVFLGCEDSLLIMILY